MKQRLLRAATLCAAWDRFLWGAMLILLVAFVVVLFVEPSAVGRGGR